ncbi:protein STRUBBELIG-RECEPTOR FAMILY 2 isoform X2 [Cannabis sativa]|uniref:protein STRUBBELIG-RECEPTOR FAMILY 2 isoform X2 n=1 Tax=Cannabis sativa TaxID=3483 RepID=UPI0029CAA937|nr:protein STRUBBELIG-RECEPTOR FAMILY 2 isoform X2 [Cannabis sativa]
MRKQSASMWSTVIVFSAIMASQTLAFTNPSEVTALQDLYWNLNLPSELRGWRTEGGDPCDESWAGVSCYESSIIYLKLRGLNLTGFLGHQLSSLCNLKQMDISFNKIWGPIPDELPPNATHINLARNNLTYNIPNSLSNLKYLRHLNLSHNFLSGPVGNVFTGLSNLREMDLSFNNFTGDLPSSFGSLKNLTGLYLQNNKFTGSVTYLSGLPLLDLNIGNNYFSGIIPDHFSTIPNLWMGGNNFHSGDSPPWHFPLETVPIEQNISRPPTTESSAIESYPIVETFITKKKSMGPGGIAFIVGGGTLVASCIVIYMSIRINQYRARRLQRSGLNNNTTHSLPVTAVRDSSPAEVEESPQMLTFRSPILGPRRMPPIYNSRTQKTSKRKSVTRKHGFPMRAKFFTIADLQSATNSFSETNLLGEGSLGSVYKAEFPDGQVMAVKNINMVTLTFKEEEQFLDVVWTVSRLKHPNIVPLIGYCAEHGQHLLIYNYIRSVPLDEALHYSGYKSLSWGLRLQIAIGVAQTLDYLHSTVSPPLAHSNLKSANILLDEELMPHVCDCGLAILRPLTSNRVKIKASEIAIGDTGYVAPEHGQSGVDSRKSDIYAFGVLLLELLTGRKPFDNSRQREEQCLVKWASSRLHDSESLEQMVDPGIKRTFSFRILSRFADVVSLCIQPVKEFRPPMSEVVESLKCLIEKVNMEQSSGADGPRPGPGPGPGPGPEMDEKSFLSTNTRFLLSPDLTNSSVDEG